MLCHFKIQRHLACALLFIHFEHSKGDVQKDVLQLSKMQRFNDTIWLPRYSTQWNGHSRDNQRMKQKSQHEFVPSNWKCQRSSLHLFCLLCSANYSIYHLIMEWISFLNWSRHRRRPKENNENFVADSLENSMKIPEWHEYAIHWVLRMRSSCQD